MKHMPVGRYCLPMTQKTAMTSNGPCHVSGVGWDKYITLNGYNVVKSRQLRCMTQERLKFRNRC